MSQDAQGRQVSDDGNYWWDGTAWQLRTSLDKLDDKPGVKWLRAGVRVATVGVQAQAANRAERRQVKAAAAAEVAKAEAAETQAAADAINQKRQRRADAQQSIEESCPLPVDPNPPPLPDGLALFEDEFILAAGKAWGWSSQRLTLTTHRLIHTHGRVMGKDQQIVYLADIRDVMFRGNMLQKTLFIETAGGRSMEGLPAAKDGKAIRDQLLAVVHWARQRSERPAEVGAAAAVSAPDKYDRLGKLAELRASGVLNEAEFAAEKAKLLA